MPKAAANKTRARPAVTVEEIAARLFTIARRLDRHTLESAGMDVEETRFIAKKLRTYAMRLRASTQTRGASDLTSTQNRACQSPTARVRIRVHNRDAS